jgi:hypothetical protein
MVTPAKARAIALAFPEASEAPHFEKPSFRVGKKIFATMGTDGFAVIKLAPDQQAMMTEVRGDLYAAVPGAWGRQGWTRVSLKAADAETLRHAFAMSYRNVAPKKLAAMVEG